MNMKMNRNWMAALAAGAWIAGGAAAQAAPACCADKGAADKPACSAEACKPAECKSADCVKTSAEVKPAALAREAAAVKAQTLCPVMNQPINPKLYVDAEGKRIYVCCKGCVGAVKANPAKYIAALEAAGVTLEAPPAAK
mgnify:CR=1 FL=1